MVCLHDDSVHDFESFDHGGFDLREQLLKLLHVVFDDLVLKFHFINMMLLNKRLDNVFLPDKITKLQQKVSPMLKKLIA